MFRPNRGTGADDACRSLPLALPWEGYPAWIVLCGPPILARVVLSRLFCVLRRSFLPRIPEFDVAATLLAQAADAFISGDGARCERLLIEADLRPLRDFAYLLAGPINPAIHRQSKNPSYAPLPPSQLPRMPAVAETRRIFRRDGYRCRFCEARVIVKEARKVFERAFPLAARKGSTNEANHFGLATLAASIDHALPFRRGGTSDLNNLVTACMPCQFGRGRWTLEEVQIEDPRSFPPIVDDWDGLTRLVGFKNSGATR